MGYISNFIVYTLAMLGVIVMALFVFKYTTGVKVNRNGSVKNLKVTESLSLSPRKTLYIVETDGERFLIAGDADRTTLISRLDYKNKTNTNNKTLNQEESLDENIGIHAINRSPYDSLMKNFRSR